MKLKFSILLFLFCTLSSILLAQDKLCLNIYAPQKIEGRGILYHQLEQSKKTSKEFLFTALDERGGQQELYYDGSRMLLKDTKTRNLFPIIIEVIAQDSEYYNLAIIEDFRTETNTRYFKVRKTDIAATDFRYLPLDKVLDIYKSESTIVQNVVGTPIIDFENNLDGTGGVVSILRKEPSDTDPLIAISLPKDSKPQVTVLSAENDYWFHLDLHYYFLYNGCQVKGSMMPGGVVFDKNYIGYWKAQTDDLDYPYLILSMLKPMYWAKFAGYVGK